MPAEARPSRLADYPVDVAGFQGPLDLLLRLVEERRLPVSELSLVAVTDQFLAHLSSLEDAPVEVLAEFAVVASRLVALKARALLPRPPEPDPTDEPEPETLVEQLRRYQALRATAEFLRQREYAGFRGIARIGRIERPPAQSRVAPAEPAALVRALERWSRRVHPPAPPLRLRPQVSLASMVRRVLVRLRQGARTFGALVGPTAGRHEVITAFLALLLLARRRVVRIEQAVPFGEIVVIPGTARAEEGAADG